MDNCLPNEVLCLFASSYEMKRGMKPDECEEFFIPQNLVDLLTRVLETYSIPNSYAGNLHPEIREELWNIIWDYSITPKD